MAEPPRVVVIDSGVDRHHPAVRGRGPLVAGPAFAADGPIDTDGGGHDVLGHGTAVAAAILQQAPAAELVSLRVFEGGAVGAFEVVLAALAHAVALQPQVINLSLGTTSLRHRRPLQALVAAATAAGCRIVTPASYGGLPCDPGNLDGVDAVVADPNVLPMLPELRPHGGRWLWFASPLPPRDADGGRRLLARGESLACATVSGFLLQRWPARANPG
jgi:hypothetical protein